MNFIKYFMKFVTASICDVEYGKLFSISFNKEFKTYSLLFYLRFGRV